MSDSNPVSTDRDGFTPALVPANFDFGGAGAGRSDASIFRPSTGLHYAHDLSGASLAATIGHGAEGAGAADEVPPPQRRRRRRR